MAYRGTFINGKPAGWGLKIENEDHSYYCGDFARGKRNGYGQMWYVDGSFYNGDWLDGVRHGKGKYLEVIHSSPIRTKSVTNAMDTEYRLISTTNYL